MQERLTMLQWIDWCVFTAKQTYIFIAGIVNLLYVRSDTKEKCLLQWLGKSYVVGVFHLQFYFEDGLKYSPCSTEWIDVHYKRICGNTLMVRNSSFMMKAYAQGDMEMAYTQKPTIKPACFIKCLQALNIKVFTFRHGLHRGRGIYSVLTFLLQVPWINGNPCYKRC